MSVLMDGDHDESFALALACKDLGLVVDLAGQVGVPVEVSAAVEQVLRLPPQDRGQLPRSGRGNCPRSIGSESV